MCSSWVFVVQSTIVTASIVPLGAETDHDLLGPGAVLGQGGARAGEPRATARASRTFRRRIDLLGLIGDQGYTVGSVELVEREPEARHEGLRK